MEPPPSSKPPEHDGTNMKKWRDDNYTEVHGQLIDTWKEEYENWEDSLLTVAQGSDQKDICRSKMEKIKKRINRL